MTTSTIRADDRGPYVRTGGYVFRPGAIRSHSHVLRMDDAGLVAGDRVRARHKGGTPLAKLVLEDGTTTFWAEEATLEKDPATAPADATWLKDGGRDMRHLDDATPNEHLPRQIEAIKGEGVIGHRPATASLTKTSPSPF